MSPDPPEHQPEILAALLWDVPSLRALDDRGGGDFVEAFSAGPLVLADPPPPGAPPLSIAAAGVAADRLGNTSLAIAQFDRLDGEGWERLLALCLRAWSSSLSSLEDLDHASEAIAEIDDPTVQARLRSKVATYAYDKGDSERFEAELRAAAAIAPEGSRLRATLIGETYNYFGDQLSWEQWRAQTPADSLVSYPWIEATRQQAAVDHFTDLVEDRALGPWSVSFRIGRGPLDEALAAEVQATWAGALWLRRAFRLQLGSQLLLSGPSEAQSAAEALRYWVLGGGGKISTVGQLVEPILDQSAVGWLIDALASRPGRPDVVETELAETAMLFWDSLPTRQIDPLLDRLPLAPGNHPTARAARQLWSFLLLRAPDAWTHRFAGASPDAQASVLEALDESKIQKLPADAARRLLKLADTGDFDESLSSPHLTRVLLSQALGASPPTETESVPRSAAERAQVSIARRSFLPDAERAAAELATSVAQSREEAHQGKVGFGGASSAQTLASLLTLADAPPATTIQPFLDALWESALDERLVTRLRLEALAGLAHLALHDRLGTDRIEELRRSGLGSRTDLEPFDMPATPDLLSAGVLLVVAGAGQLREEEEVALLWRSRSPDARARELAINACGISMAQKPSALLSQVIFSGLFDGEEGVVARALQELDRVSLTPAALGDLVAGRVLELLRTRRRRVRVTCAQLAFRHGDDDQRFQPVLVAARADKSWQVQQAAQGAL